MIRLESGKLASNKEVSKGDATFDFLGFTHYWARTRVGYWVIKGKTVKTALAVLLRNIQEVGAIKRDLD